MPTFDQFLTSMSDATSLNYTEQLLLLQNSITKKVALGDVLLKYALGYIDPHLPPYNAKGDTVFYNDGLTTGTANEFSSVGHVFGAQDVGKLLYGDLFGGGSFRTVTAYNSGNNSISYSGATAGVNLAGRYWYMGTDDTDAINLALAYANTISNKGGGLVGGAGSYSPNNNFGGTVKLRGGCCYLVKCTAAMAAQGKTAAIEVLQRTALVGESPSSTQIIIGADNVGHGIANKNAGGFNDFITLANFRIFGSKGITTTANLDAIHIDLSIGTYRYTDACTNIHNVDIFEAKQDGLYLNGRGEAIISHVRVFFSGRRNIYNPGMYDSTYIGVNSGGSNKSGIYLSGAASSRFIGCKSFYSGAGGAALDSDCANWYFISNDAKNSNSTQFIGCEAQESRGSGFVLEGVGRVSFVGGQYNDPGRTPIASGTLPTVVAGIHIKGTSDQIVFNGPRIGTSVGIYSTTANWGLAKDALVIDTGAKRLMGDIYVEADLMYAATFGIKSGGGLTNGLNTGLRINGVSCT